jgi:tRNA nucleotidyltransferase/poly(A) polymerase
MNPEFYTIRAKDPVLGVVDFVWCRKEGPYSDGRHPDWVEPGSLMDDLSRRDFTMNAMAIEEGTETVIDPYGGTTDIVNNIIRCVGNPVERFIEDGLRVFRALRFSITKNMTIAGDVGIAMTSFHSLASASSVSVDRVREELALMMKADWWTSMYLLMYKYPPLGTMIAKKWPDLWLKPTIEKR